MVISKPKRPKNVRQAYYTNCGHITAYMASRLAVDDHDVVWEPCAGKGVLIDAVLECATGATIVATEIDAEEVAFLEKKYAGRQNIRVFRRDALFLDGEVHSFAGTLSKIIANPPYGAWQDFCRRKELKTRFPGLYVKETYGVFLFHCFQQLEGGGRLVFIVPDTFLWLHRHEYLRNRLFLEGTIEEIAIFPSRFFPGVDFGYSGLCIITIEKSFPTPESKIRVIRNIKEPAILGGLASGKEAPDGCDVLFVRQRTIIDADHCCLRLPENGRQTVVSKQHQTLGDVADIVTGFYSGNDRHWLRYGVEKVRGAKHYLRVNPEQVVPAMLDKVPSLEGIESDVSFIPIVRGGSSPFVKPTQWYVDWSKEAVSEYRRKGDNPARFQNARYYFRQGIGVPMVASAGLTGALLDHRLFDQGIVAVFPREEELLIFILGFLNSRLATELIRSINPTANNSANYLKRIPFVVPTVSDRKLVETLVRDIVRAMREGAYAPCQLLDNLDSELRRIWNLSEDSVSEEGSAENDKLPNAQSGACHDLSAQHPNGVDGRSSQSCAVGSKKAAKWNATLFS